MTEEMEIGRTLRLAREKAGVSLEEFSELTLMPLKHLEYLESENWRNLPPDAYLKAMIAKYGDYFDFDPKPLQAKLSQAREPLVAGKNDALPVNRFAVSRPFYWSTAFRWPQIEWHPGFILFFAAGIWLLWGARVLFMPPRFDLNLPEVVSSDAAAGSFLVKGRIEGARRLQVNSDEVLIRRDGEFETRIVLLPGPNAVRFEAQNYLGKKIQLTKYIIYQAPPNALQGL